MDDAVENEVTSEVATSETEAEATVGAEAPQESHVSIEEASDEDLTYNLKQYQEKGDAWFGAPETNAETGQPAQAAEPQKTQPVQAEPAPQEQHQEHPDNSGLLRQRSSELLQFQNRLEQENEALRKSMAEKFAQARGSFRITSSPVTLRRKTWPRPLAATVSSRKRSSSTFKTHLRTAHRPRCFTSSGQPTVKSF
jgi:hypothetical protein